MRIQIDLIGERQIDRRLERYIGLSANMEPVFEEIHTYLLNIEEKQFGSQGRFSGHPWAALAQSTKDFKARAGLDPRILHATLALRKSLTKEGDPSHVKFIGPSIMVFGTTIPYAIYHQKPQGDLTRRRPIDLTETQKVTMMKMIQAFLRTARNLRV